MLLVKGYVLQSYCVRQEPPAEPKLYSETCYVDVAADFAGASMATYRQHMDEMDRALAGPVKLALDGCVVAPDDDPAFDHKLISHPITQSMGPVYVIKGEDLGSVCAFVYAHVCHAALQSTDGALRHVTLLQGSRPRVRVSAPEGNAGEMLPWALEKAVLANVQQIEPIPIHLRCT